MIEKADRTSGVDSYHITLTVNGQLWSGSVPVTEMLLDFLRSRLNLTGPKRACESEVCGACTVLVDGKPMSSCTFLVWEASGKTVTTIEGVGLGGQLDALQEAFVRNVGAQCGYCTPGQIMAAKALLAVNPLPTYEEICDWLKGNICRCGSYSAIVASILETCRGTDATLWRRQE